ncbi:hypothetical protein Vafri_16866 [Volvox africanus]|uniref:Uncharacterized protein n=1 Tax=Volvox africanus TaxID=51714 RepID=A0A8J4BJ73_9CHLO|nr:hypothetical protein Vafri_16866 [Volvox africanus]
MTGFSTWNACVISTQEKPCPTYPVHHGKISPVSSCRYSALSWTGINGSSSRSCPHDSDSWMIAPEFCYAIPQTTRQLTGNVAQEEGAEATVRGSLARSRTKAAQRTQYATSFAKQEEVRGNRQVTGKIIPARQHAVAGPMQHSATGAGSSDGGDTDRYGYTDRDGGDWSGGELQDDEPEEEAEQRLQCTMPSLREDRAACAGVPVGGLAANAKAYGVGSLAGRTQALLGVTAAAAAALGDEELDLNDAGTRTALCAAQASTVLLSCVVTGIGLPIFFLKRFLSFSLFYQ